MKLNENDGFSCFLAGTRITRGNGGTMVTLGSHKWEYDRRGRPDEVSFLGQTYVRRQLVGDLALNSMPFRNGARFRFHFLQHLAHGAG